MSSDEPFALSTMAESAPPAEAEYEAICTAFMETQRGRWFLAEYARRNRNTDTKLVLDAISRIEDTVKAGSAAQSTDRFRSALTDMAQAIARTKADIAALRPEAEHHGKISEASEELDLIVDATARATSEILAAAEHIQEAAWTMREQGIDSRFCDELDA
jgi:methyl-accepting chemotaxis protein